MVFKLGQSAQRKWRRLRGFKLLAEIIRRVKFKDGERIKSLEESGLDRIVNIMTPVNPVNYLVGKRRKFGLSPV